MSTLATTIRIRAKISNDFVRVKSQELIELLDMVDGAFHGQACEHTTLFDVRETLGNFLIDTQRRTK